MNKDIEETLKDVSRTVEKNNEAQEGLEKKITPLLDHKDNFLTDSDFSSIQEMLTESFAPIIQQTNQMKKIIAESIKPIAVEVNRDFSEEEEEIFNHLASRGWFLTGDMPAYFHRELYRMLDKENSDEKIKRKIEAHLYGRISGYKEKAIKTWPEHSQILSQAFEAQQNEMYAVSIPTFLAQADGMFQKIGRSEFFDFLQKGEQKRKTQLVKNFNELANKKNFFVNKFFLRQIYIKRCIRMSESELSRNRQKDPKYAPLNRHEILHGQNTKYHTQSNSLRVISLVKYLTDLKQILEDQF